MTYFEKRALEVEEKAFLTSIKMQKKLIKLYKDSEKQVRALINDFYMKFTIDNNITYQEALKMLNDSEYKEWRMSIKEYLELAKETGNEDLIKELDVLSMRSRINRLDSLLTQIQSEQGLLINKQLNLFDEGLGDIYKTSYYQTIYNIQNFNKIYYSFSVVNKETIKKVLSYKYNGENYSKRIWGSHRKKLFTDVQTQIAQGLATGKGNKEIAKDIAERYNVAIHNANRLVRTESSFYLNQANLDSMNETFAEEYIFVATLDRRTSKICRSLDGKIFKKSEAKVGVNYPPMHPNCRSTEAIYIEGITNYEKRVMRNAEGKSVIKEYMTYDEWEKEYINK